MITPALRLACLSFLIAAHALPLLARGGGGIPTTLPWHDDAEAAFKEARESGLPVLAVFR